jgi:uncharacterized membrane protein
LIFLSMKTKGDVKQIPGTLLNAVRKIIGRESGVIFFPRAKPGTHSRGKKIRAAAIDRVEKIFLNFLFSFFLPKIVDIFGS